MSAVSPSRSTSSTEACRSRSTVAQSMCPRMHATIKGVIFPYPTERFTMSCELPASSRARTSSCLPWWHASIIASSKVSRTDVSAAMQPTPVDSRRKCRRLHLVRNPSLGGFFPRCRQLQPRLTKARLRGTCTCTCSGHAACQVTSVREILLVRGHVPLSAA